MVICKYFQQGCCKYGNNCRFEHVFGSKYTYNSRTPQQNTANQNVFNQANGTSASSLFRSAVQSNVPSVFCQNPASRPSVFNRLGHQPHQPNAFNENQAKSIFSQATQNVFAQANAQMHAHVPQNQNQMTANPRSVFAQANHNVFAPQPNNAANLFASAAQNVFNAQSSMMSNSAALPARPPTNVFHISKPTNVFSGANSSFEISDDNLYSNVEDLSKTDIEAFEGADFKLGCIPELPPPKALCV